MEEAMDRHGCPRRDVRWRPTLAQKSVSPPVVASADGIDLRNEGFPTSRCKSEFLAAVFSSLRQLCLHSQADISVDPQRHKLTQEWNVNLQVRVLVQASPEGLIFHLRLANRRKDENQLNHVI